MTTQNIETVTSKTGSALVALAVAAVLAGVLGFSFLTDRPMLTRVGILAAGIVAGIGIAWLSPSGKRFLAFAREAYDETRRVVWPSRKETLNMTGIVFALVVVVALFLFIVDMLLEWGLYDLLLGWK
ncbi:MAG: preprotein translocase subunit SecE [Burkholderiaceae bacterium]|jgi:preprotein translocase subunit SecE|nr:preprotein translocase subunit SecE [Burkholderiaceae bacterium]